MGKGAVPLLSGADSDGSLSLTSFERVIFLLFFPFSLKGKEEGREEDRKQGGKRREKSFENKPNKKTQNKARRFRVGWGGVIERPPLQCRASVSGTPSQGHESLTSLHYPTCLS